jgi:plasmid stabilization system protein ParE
MTYTVIIVPSAESDFQRQYDYIKERSKRNADSWANAFHRALKKLHTQPATYAIAPECENDERDIRQLLFKTRQGLTYRALFVIREDLVRIIHIRGAGQDIINPNEIQSTE